MRNENVASHGVATFLLIPLRRGNGIDAAASFVPLGLLLEKRFRCPSAKALGYYQENARWSAGTIPRK
jgi:hypothetical protein